MSFDRSDFSRIAGSLAAAVSMIIVGVGTVVLAERQLAEASRETAAAARLLAEFDGKLRQAYAEENEIRQHAALYSNLQARGVIGEEQRLDWVELIKETKENRQLLDVQYEFAPQQALDRERSWPGFSFRNSPMKLQMKLLHEGDLLNFLKDLLKHARAHVRVRNCSIGRIPHGLGAGIETPAHAALLDAECQVDWITIRPAKEEK